MKNHIIKSFKVNEQTFKMFEEASNELGIQKSQLSRLLFNRALKDLKTTSINLGGYSEITITIKELREIR